MFTIQTGRAIAAALVLTVMPAAGFAATFDVLQQRTNISDDGMGMGAKSVSGQLSIPDLGNSPNQDVINTAAGSFHLKKRPTGSTTAYEDFIAFCIEVTQTIDINTTEPATVYTEDNNLFNADRRELLSTLIGTAFDPAANAQHHAATQIAIWKLAFGNIASGGDAFDVSAQSANNLPFGFLGMDELGMNTFDDNSEGVFDIANGWLDKLDGVEGNGEWDRLPGQRISFLTADSSQNLVTYTAPIPVPAAGGLLMGAIAGLAALRRRRKAA